MASHQARPYKFACPHKKCPRYFNCQHNVRQHFREKHSKEKPYQCESCSAAFARPWSLYRHTFQIHGIDIRPGKGRRRRKQVGHQGDTPSPYLGADEGNPVAGPSRQSQTNDEMFHGVDSIIRGDPADLTLPAASQYMSEELRTLEDFEMSNGHMTETKPQPLDGTSVAPAPFTFSDFINDNGMLSVDVPQSEFDGFNPDDVFDTSNFAFAPAQAFDPFPQIEGSDCVIQSDNTPDDKFSFEEWVEQADSFIEKGQVRIDESHEVLSIL